MIKLCNFDEWNIYNGFSHGSGRSEKFWLQSETGKIGLFKLPKVDAIGQVSSTEYLSEHLASRIGDVLGVPTARIDIGYRDERIGSMSYLIPNKIEEGVHYITRKYPSFDSGTLYAEEEGIYYSLDMIIDSVGDTLEEGWFLPMLLFDFIIGNSDRHQSNWAIQKTQDKKRILSPLYDNGSSLCSYIQEKDVDNYLGKDRLRFEALVKSKSKSRIRIDGSNKKEPTHADVMRFIFSKYEYSRILADDFIQKLSRDKIETIMMEYPSNILSDKKRILIVKFIAAKMTYLSELLMEKRLK